MRQDIDSQPVTDDGLVGVLCTPAGAGPAPGVLLLGGSEGGLHERDARELAGHGFTVLALAYFGAPGLPPGLVDVPLEYFARGLDVLAGQPRAGQRFAVVGGSRGGEAALLAGAHDERVGAVVSVVGSGVVTQGIDYRRGRLLDILSHPANSWTWRGGPLPYLPYVVTAELRELVAAGRLARGQHPYPAEHRVLAGAGHGIAGPPGEPATGTTSPGPGVTFELGGTPAVTNAARAQAWQATVDFLRAQLT
jgi:dienelactone hydrolase